ncbi:hypothetical protein SCLARK_001226 [Spiroplasma clarkii]|nr:hypothetical protein SCLARK_001226 [Spiroplasma clarkii]
MNLIDIIDLPQNKFDEIENEINKKNKNKSIFEILRICRKLDAGKNIIRYILFSMRYKIIKGQYFDRGNPLLSSLF